MNIVYINLDHRTDRRLHMERLLSYIGLPYERFEAIQINIDSIMQNDFSWHPLAEFFPSNAYAQSCSILKNRLSRVSDYDPTPARTRICGEYGCYLSHYVIHKQRLGNTEPYIIIEDDVTFGRETIDDLNKLISHPLYSDWDMFRSLWFSQGNDPYVGKIDTVHPTSLYNKEYEVAPLHGGTHFTACKSAKTILDYLDSEVINEVDAVYSTGVINVYHAKMGIYLAPGISTKTDIPKIRDDQ